MTTDDTFPRLGARRPIPTRWGYPIRFARSAFLRSIHGPESAWISRPTGIHRTSAMDLVRYAQPTGITA